MNIFERWKMAKDDERCVSQHGWFFTKCDCQSFQEMLKEIDLPDRAILDDDWPAPKPPKINKIKRMQIVTGIRFTKRSVNYGSGYGILSDQGFFVPANVVGKVFKATLEWEE